METLLEMPIKLNQMSPLSLAFVGDGVYELLVREYLASTQNYAVKTLNANKVKLVCCAAQAEALRDRLLPILTEQEAEVYRRGRNAHVGHVPKNASIADYHSATGVECLFGYLYLNREIDRIRTLFSVIIAED